MNRPPHSLQTGTTARIYQELFQQIVCGTLEPNTLLSESELAKQMESSRTPVREALLMLEGDGLLRRYPGRGYLVTEVTPQDVDEIFELRIELERLALKKAYPNLDSTLLLKLEAQLESLGFQSSPDDFYQADRTLHKLLARFCENSRLQQFLRMLDSQIERLRCISARRPDRLTESRQEHLDIIHALMQQDLPKAEACLVKHIQNVGESTKQVCRLHQSRNPFPTEHDWAAPPESVPVYSTEKEIV